MKSQTMEWVACRMCSFPITTYSVFIRFLNFLLIFFLCFKKHSPYITSSSILCLLFLFFFFGRGWWGDIGGGGDWVSLLFCFLIFPVCSAHLFTHEVGVLLFEQQCHLPHLFLCNAKEHGGEKAALLGNMLNEPKQYLKQLTLTLTRWEFHAYRVNGEAATNREK